jgi:hypothetical protein
MVPKVLAPAMRAGATVPAQRRRAAAQDGGERAALVSGQPCACARQELRPPVTAVSGELAQIDAGFQQVRGILLSPISRAR